MPATMSSNLSQRPQRKKQTRLAFDPVGPSSSATRSPARVRYQLSSPQPKAFDLTSPEPPADGELTDAPLSGNKYAGTPKRQRKNGKIPFEPLVTPAGSSQTQAETAKPTGKPSFQNLRKTVFHSIICTLRNGHIDRG